MNNKGGGCPHCGQRKFTNVKFADSVNKKYPIDTPAHIKSSWEALHAAKISGKYPEESFKMMEEKVINAWLRHVNLEGPPAKKKV